MSDSYHPLYQTIYEDIVNKIKSNQLQPGDKLPTEFEMMDQYDVSRITASRALQELARSGYVVRYRSKGTFVLEHKQAQPASLASPAGTADSNNIAFVMPFSAGIIPQMLSAMQHAAQKNNFVLSIFNSEKSVEKERKILSQLADMPLAGVICQPIESFYNVSYYAPFVLRKTPLLSLDKTIPYAGVPCIKSDNYKCAYKMTQYLIDKGHTRIAFYTHTLKDENEKQRFLGYLNALIDNNILPNSEYFFEIEKDNCPQDMMPEDSSVFHTIIYEQLQKMMALSPPPTALFCAFDLIAAYVQQQASRLEIAIPDTLSVVGFDNLSLCDHLQVPLTSVAQDYKAIGTKAIELIFRQIVGKSVETSCLIDGEVVERNSVKDLRGE